MTTIRAIRRNTTWILAAHAMGIALFALSSGCASTGYMGNRLHAERFVDPLAQNALHVAQHGILKIPTMGLPKQFFDILLQSKLPLY